MIRANRSMPVCTVIPVLSYPDVREAVAWLCGAFGFVERLRIGDHRSQLAFADGAVVIAGAGVSPAPVAGHSVMVRVGDARAHCGHAQRAGARIVSPPVDQPYGERQYSAIDPAGHVWTFSQTIADVDPIDRGAVLC